MLNTWKSRGVSKTKTNNLKPLLGETAPLLSCVPEKALKEGNWSLSGLFWAIFHWWPWEKELFWGKTALFLSCVPEMTLKKENLYLSGVTALVLSYVPLRTLKREINLFQVRQHCFWAMFQRWLWRGKFISFRTVLSHVPEMTLKEGN